MILTDVNVLVYAHKSGAHDHERYATWLEEQRVKPEAFGVSELVLSRFVRIVTHSRIFDRPSEISVALAFADAIRSQPNAVPVSPGRRHWAIFADLCRNSGAKGNLVPDAYYAAMAIEAGCEWITTDRDYARFEGLRWRQPLAWVLVAAPVCGTSNDLGRTVVSSRPLGPATVARPAPGDRRPAKACDGWLRRPRSRRAL